MPDAAMGGLLMQRCSSCSDGDISGDAGTVDVDVDVDVVKSRDVSRKDSM